jgi:hypothetical protein
MPGDLIVGGGSVDVDGTVSGDLLAFGGKIRLGQDVAGSVLAAGGQLTVNGKVGRNLRMAGGQLEFGPKSEVAGNVTAAGGPAAAVRAARAAADPGLKIEVEVQSYEEFIEAAVEVSEKHPILIDKFLEDAIEVDVDAIADGKTCVIGGILEHIEEAGIHSGDSAMVLPPHTLGKDIIETIKKNTYAMAKELNVKGLMNIQFAVKNNIVYVLEVNPRASRTVPFVSKVIGVPLAKLASTRQVLSDSPRAWGDTNVTDTVMTNWLGHGKFGTAPHMIEVTPEKKVVWTFADHKIGRAHV